MSFAEKVREARKAAGLSQEELAEELNVSRQSVAKWETEVSFPEMKMALSLATKLNTSLDALFKDELSSMSEEIQRHLIEREEDDRENQLARMKLGRKILVNAALDEMKQNYIPSSVRTGYGAIDDSPCAFNRCGLVVICGCVSIGKSMFALNITRNILNEGNTVWYFNRRASSKRIMSMLLGISASVESLTGKTISREEEEKLRLAGEFITDSSFVLEDVFDKSVEYIYEKCVNQSGHMDMIIIDGVEELFSSANGQDQNVVLKTLRKMAHLCRCPVVALYKIDDYVEALNETDNKELFTEPAPEEVIIKLEKELPIGWYDGLIFVNRMDYYRRPKEHDGSISLVMRTPGCGENLETITCRLNYDPYTMVISE